MKGISTVIATILMLMITIALAGTAYLYISGTFQQQTGAALDVLDSFCASGTAAADSISVTVENAGTATIGTVTIAAVNPAGAGSGGSPCTIASLTAGTSGSCSINRIAADASGIYQLAVSAPGARTVRGTVSCATAGS